MFRLVPFQSEQRYRGQKVIQCC